MKRVAAIVLLSIHLFFTGGYTLVFQYFINRADSRMVKHVYASDLNDKKLILLKVPVNMPTVNDWTEYEAVAGQIQLKGAYYNYVKIKMTRDTMFLVCYANTEKTQLVKANINTAKEFNDVPMSKKSDTISKKLNTLSEYNLQTLQYEHPLAKSFAGTEFSFNISRPDNPYIDSPGKPPNAVC